MKYLNIALILGLLAAVFGAYKKGESAGEAEILQQWQAERIERQAEIIKLQKERDQARLAAEQAKARIEIKTVEVIRESRQIVDECADRPVNPDLLRVYTH